MYVRENLGTLRITTDKGLFEEKEKGTILKMERRHTSRKIIIYNSTNQRRKGKTQVSLTTDFMIKSQSR